MQGLWCKSEENMAAAENCQSFCYFFMNTQVCARISKTSEINGTEKKLEKVQNYFIDHVRDEKIKLENETLRKERVTPFYHLSKMSQKVGCDIQFLCQFSQTS